MTNEQKAIKALDKAKSKFPYLLRVNSRGAVISIYNISARIPNLGEHSNNELCTLNIDSGMSVSEIASAIDKKWGTQ